MRVSDDMVISMLTGNMLDSKDAYYQLQKKIASGKEISLPSDNPGDYELISRLYNNYSIDEQKLKNSDDLQLGLYSLDTTLESVGDLLHRASELVVNASDGTKPPEDREAMAEEVDLLLNQLVDAANSKPMGKYIFGGLRTDVPPYTVTRDANGRIDSVTYQGNTGVREVEIGKFIPGSGANKIEANIPGSDTTSANAVFQTNEGDIFQTLMRVRDRLLLGRNPVEVEEFTADPVTDNLTVSQTYTTGAIVSISSDGTLPAIAGGGNLVEGKNYYVINVSPTEIRLADTYDDAINGVQINITGPGTGVHEIGRMFTAELNNAMDHINSLRASVGSKLERLDSNHDTLSQRQITMNDTIGAKESVDIAEATIELTQQQTAYEAALRVIAGTLNSSVLDYI